MFNPFHLCHSALMLVLLAGPSSTLRIVIIVYDIIHLYVVITIGIVVLFENLLLKLLSHIGGQCNTTHVGSTRYFT